MPTWATTWAKLIPGFITKLQAELSMLPNSVSQEIWEEAHNPECNPEIVWDAVVRVGAELCPDECDFLAHRRPYTRTALARYLDLPEEDIHPDDVPVIAMCGSGGGLRALVAGAASYLSAREAGLFDCITYTAGVSGSCWLQALYFSSVGGQSHRQIIRHLKDRLDVHLADPIKALPMLTSAPTNKFLLTGLVEKFIGVPEADLGIVDMYGILLAARLFVPKGELAADLEDLKLSNQARYLSKGENPLPIYTAVRHEIPPDEEDTAAAKEKAKREAWFQWFEFTPYEFFTEELPAGIPTWAMGRPFTSGLPIPRPNGLAAPETRLPLLLAIWGSAFCATLSHYYKEIRPLLATIPALDGLISERDAALRKLHPIDPASLPNFAHALSPSVLPPTSAPGALLTSPMLSLMDAGMSNNLPIYPLLRPDRNVDVLIAFDASADVRADNWLAEVDGYAQRRGVVGWPIGAGWPPANTSVQQSVKEMTDAEADSVADARGKIADAASKDTQPGLGYCSIWVGSKTSATAKGTDAPAAPAPPVSEDYELQAPGAGLCVIYFPLVANPRVEGVDPGKSAFLSTWNMVYTPEQIEGVVALARANFDEGHERTKRAVRAVYERKKAERLGREREEWEMGRIEMGRRALKAHQDQFRW
ncbi:FabD/lysophospholipase-like protein [Trichodelitschia bisporula]|uniref:Lysophospholipase n=1 Tax=Trichodelitschia bisporula TaxID=703511 RepID=A0A6G1I0C7_9PEZI|nr:FabD/lysophospholipase-like protein [Trichodelitschia bisporula]